MLSTIVQSCLHQRNRKNHQRRVNSRHWDKAPRWVQERLSPQALSTFLVILQLTQGRPKRLPTRLIASRRGKSFRTIYNHVAEMIDAKVLRVSRMKVERCRNAPNLYTLLEIDGGALQTAPAKNCREKRVQNLKPTTPALVARGVEVSRVKAENNPPMVAKIYNQNAVLMAENRSLRALVRGKHTWNGGSDPTIGKSAETTHKTLSQESLDKHNAVMAEYLAGIESMKSGKVL